MTDKQLYKICKKYGRKCLEARRRFSGLLPEVLRRNLYEKKGFGSIYEFAARLAGMTRDQVDTVLCLDRRFADKPLLHEALLQGRIGASKLIRIASVATTENQQALFETAQKLSKQALDVFVKEMRAEKVDSGTMGSGVANGKSGNGLIDSIYDDCDGLFKGFSGDKSLPGQGNLTAKSGKTMTNHSDWCDASEGLAKPLNFDYEILAALSPEVKAKPKDLIDKNIDTNGLLMDFFVERERKIEDRKEAIAKELNNQNSKALTGAMNGQKLGDINCGVMAKRPLSRHILAKVRRLLGEEFGDKCAVEGCNAKSVNIHHVLGFAMTKSHDPIHLKPLCRAHHEIEHKDDTRYQRFKSGNGS